MVFLKGLGRSYCCAILIVLGGALSGLIQGEVSADPSDDFSFTLGAEHRSHKHTMTPLQVESVLLSRIQGVSTTETRKLAKELVALCQAHRFDPAFILALIHVESGFKVGARSSAGAIGLLQLMPATAEFIAKKWGITYQGPSDLFNPHKNLSLGLAYLAYLRDLFPDRSHFFLLAAYNMGPYALKKRIGANDFRPVETLRYYRQIRRAVPEFRYYKPV
jgi:hypothetical protein